MKQKWKKKTPCQHFRWKTWNNGLPRGKWPTFKFEAWRAYHLCRIVHPGFNLRLEVQGRCKLPRGDEDKYLGDDFSKRKKLSAGADICWNWCCKGQRVELLLKTVNRLSYYLLFLLLFYKLYISKLANLSLLFHSFYFKTNASIFCFSIVFLDIFLILISHFRLNSTYF